MQVFIIVTLACCALNIITYKNGWTAIWNLGYIIWGIVVLMNGEI